MSGRREVNVERLEHSWIPFYRELAEKLVEDGWRERQGNLMDLMREMAVDDNLGVPEGVARSEDPFLDPFSLYASFNNSSRGEKRLLPIQRVGEFFGLKAKILHADDYVPEVRSENAMFFHGKSGYRDDVESHWDTFEFVLNNDPFDHGFDRSQFVSLMDSSLAVTGIRVSKMTAAFYWINPANFLHKDTINGILGRQYLDDDANASDYIDALFGAVRTDGRSFPEINDEVYLRDHPPVTPPKVWTVRGGRDEHAADQFLSQNRIGIGFGMGGVDLSVLGNRREIANAYREANADANNRSVGQNTGQIKNFIVDINVGDYVMMPVGDQIHYGAITSRPYHDPDARYENTRNVAWYEAPIPRERLSDLPLRKTVSEVKEQLMEEFWHWVRPSSLPEFKMPEDSWVPFNLEVGQKLIEGEWWREERRDEFARMIHDIRWIDPGDVAISVGNKGWGPDPYSFYDSFSIWKQGPDGTDVYQIIEKMMGIEADMPSEQHGPYGLHWGWDVPIDEEEVSFLWEFFRFAVEFGPLTGDADSEQRFIEYYDRASSADFLPGKRGRVWSYFLYWIDPTKYVIARRLRKKDLGLVDDLGVSEELSTGAEYMKALKGIAELGAKHGFTVLDVNRKSTTREMLGLDPLFGPIDEAYDVDAMLDDGVFLEEVEFRRMLRILRTKKNLILQGPPGVGKTFIARRLAYTLIGRKAQDRVESVQFHQSYSYEDFVGGYRPDVKDGRMVFEPKNGPFLMLCNAAKGESEDRFVLFIDEINRGNLSRVFGELLMLIEADKRSSEYAVRLQHRTDDAGRFFVPENVYIIGTMNLADPSLTGMNVAMRRRFGFFDLKPQFGKSVFTDWLQLETEMPSDIRERVNTKMVTLNDEIRDDPSLGENYAVGHSFFCPPKGEPEGGWEEWYKTVVDYEIRPLLREYWFDAPDTANDHADKLLGND